MLRQRHVLTSASMLPKVQTEIGAAFGHRIKPVISHLGVFFYNIHNSLILYKMQMRNRVILRPKINPQETRWFVLKCVCV